MSEPHDTAYDYDVIVVGAGGAGLAASVSAAEAGARVLLLEAEDEIGGSTQLSAGLLTASATSVQESLGIDDSPLRMFQHYMDLNGWRVRPGPVRMFCEQSSGTVEWLLGLGVEIPAQVSRSAHEPGLTRAGVEDVWRGHVPKDQGYGLVQVLDRARARLHVDLALGSRVEDLVVRNGAVHGVVLEGEEATAPAVVIASGGLAADPDLVRRFLPDARTAGDALFVVAAPGARGDHVGLAERHGLSLFGQGWGLLLVTAEFQRYHHWQSGFPPASRIHVGPDGRRCMDEDAPYAVSPGILKDHGGWVWSVFDDDARASLSPGYADWDADRVLEEAAKGVVLRADTLEELADLMDVPADHLTASVARFNTLFADGTDEDFLRHESLAAKGVDPRLAPIATGPFHAVRMLPAELVCTHTGLEVDARTRVLGTDGRALPGLYAAGEAAGGILGERYVGGGNSVAHALVLGRVAGREAAARAAVLSSRLEEEPV
ncbi:fumarate reductase [Streptomyces sp. 604F]|uniref:FAD-dependent oxidoreductase n=1 Tax=Streptomyces sp. 604F TaxID=1476754 RepID=UPI0013984DEA|nr:FAD-dependent oxidoreductase [Streptomyces sp. 604F]MBP3075910.1 fumarate reductase [Streptomyces sp. 604F]QHV88821.1 FAD-binding dehydrogenase [Streptomyces sp. 604F]